MAFWGWADRAACWLAFPPAGSLMRLMVWEPWWQWLKIPVWELAWSRRAGGRVLCTAWKALIER